MGCCYYLLNHLAKLLQKIIVSRKPTHLIMLLRSFVIILQSCYNDHSIPEKPTHVATIFCNHLVKLLQKIIVSRKTNTSHHTPCFVIILQSCHKRYKNIALPLHAIFFLTILCSPNEDFGNPKQKMKCAFSRCFSRV